MSRRKLLIALGLAAIAAASWFVYRNASIERLRAEFRPWMARLERWRDANEAARRALRSREATAADPEGIAELRAWAWNGLERLAFVDYRVEKPTHDGESTTGRVAFTVGGFRTDGARVERSASAMVTESGAERRSASRSRSPSASRPPRAFATPPPKPGSVRRGTTRRSTRSTTSSRTCGPGSGVAVLDFDRDGAEDLFVGDGLRSILYKGDGAGHFTDVTEKTGLAKSPTEGIPATGLAAGDVDGDGYPDLFVTNAFGPARLFRNRGDGTFEETTAASGIAVPANARSAAFADVDGDGDIDLFVAVTGDYYSQMPDPAFDAKDGRPNFLYLNDGHGRFTDATKAWGIADETRWTLSALFQDYDQDGREDILATNDFGLKNLYRNLGGRFEDVAKKTGTLARAYGMSGAWADYDGDGRPDIYATGTDTQWYFLHEYPSIPVAFWGRVFLSVAVQWCEDMASGNTLLLQRPDHTFEDATARSGAKHAGWNWSSVAADLDDDGWPDLYATNGLWGDGRDRDVALEFWWQTLAYWDDYVAGTKTFDRKGAGINGIERDRYFRNRGGAGAGDPALRGARVSRRARSRVERPGRGRLRRQRRRRARPLRPLGAGARGPLPRLAARRRALPAPPPGGHARHRQSERDRRPHRSDPARGPPDRDRERQRERLSLDGQPHRPPRPGERGIRGGPRRDLALREDSESRTDRGGRPRGRGGRGRARSSRSRVPALD